MSHQDTQDTPQKGAFGRGAASPKRPQGGGATGGCPFCALRRQECEAIRQERELLRERLDAQADGHPGQAGDQARAGDRAQREAEWRKEVEGLQADYAKAQADREKGPGRTRSGPGATRGDPARLGRGVDGM